MKYRSIMIGTIISCFLILAMPLIPAVNNQNIKHAVNEEINNIKLDIEEKYLIKVDKIIEIFDKLDLEKLFYRFGALFLLLINTINIVLLIEINALWVYFVGYGTTWTLLSIILHLLNGAEVNLISLILAFIAGIIISTLYIPVGLNMLLFGELRGPLAVLYEALFNNCIVG